eukprot:NODE_1543_length_944_cov_373.329609_g689_i1.p1 GENE.NODE_1543_length_944_cov_373.329609_g689_i1~~NODE_1543_length_944_cov_373.329609_g689_i1.p1  ORF type:complete len:200 (-),score=74.01 NODE_1543_length_944_cov_373.329609_g689_i1:343-915(-)
MGCGIRSIPVNFFFFYHCQSLFNAVCIVMPLLLATRDPRPWAGGHPCEWVAIAVWLLAYVFENIADTQLAAFAVKQSKARKAAEAEGRTVPLAVMDQGLWKYSRHPNYFCEFLLTCSYALYTLPAARESWHFMALACLPVGGYWFLVHFTGAWMAEQGSLKRRGEAYRDYVARTSSFVPWPPRARTHRND